MGSSETEHGAPNRVALEWHLSDSAVEQHKDPSGEGEHLVEIARIHDNGRPAPGCIPKTAMYCGRRSDVESPGRIFHDECIRRELVRRCSELAGEHELLLVPTRQRAKGSLRVCSPDVERLCQRRCVRAHRRPIDSSASRTSSVQRDVVRNRPIEKNSIAMTILWHEAYDRWQLKPPGGDAATARKHTKQLPLASTVHRGNADYFAASHCERSVPYPETSLTISNGYVIGDEDGSAPII